MEVAEDEDRSDKVVAVEEDEVWEVVGGATDEEDPSFRAAPWLGGGDDPMMTAWDPGNSSDRLPVVFQEDNIFDNK